MAQFNNIAKLVRASRLNHPKKFSQSELSKILGYKNGQFISNVERGLCSMPKKILRKLSETLDVDKEVLITAVLKDERETLENHW